MYVMSKRINFKRNMKNAVEKHGGQAVADHINSFHNLGQLDDSEFVLHMDRLYEYLTPEQKRSIDQRRDCRSPGQLFLELKSGIKMENMLTLAFAKEVLLPVFKLPKEYANYRANKGRPWIDKKLVVKDADYVLRLKDRELPVDVKYLKNPLICTPKQDDLKFCVENRIYMLLFWAKNPDLTKKTFDRRGTKFAFLAPSAMQRMLTNVEVCFPFFYGGEKPARQVRLEGKPNFTEYFEQHHWDAKSFEIPE